MKKETWKYENVFVSDISEKHIVTNFQVSNLARYIRASTFCDIISTMPGKNEAVVSLFFLRNQTDENLWTCKCGKQLNQKKGMGWVALI